MSSPHDFIDFTNQIDEKEEIVDNNDCLNFYLRLTDDRYKALLERSSSKYDFDHLLNKTDTTISATANLCKVDPKKATGEPELVSCISGTGPCKPCGVNYKIFCKGFSIFEKTTLVERDSLVFRHVEQHGVCAITNKPFTLNDTEPHDIIDVDISLVIEDDEAGWEEFNPVLTENEKWTLINDMKRAAAANGMNLIEAMKMNDD